MSLYYSIDSYELKTIDDNLIEQWKINNNPKYSYYILAPEKPSANAVWNNGVWEEISSTIPSSVSARQIRLWLITNGISLEQIDSAINNIPDPMIRDMTRVEWEYAPYIERYHPMIEPLSQSLGMNSSQVDQAFIEASNI